VTLLSYQELFWHVYEFGSYSLLKITEFIKVVKQERNGQVPVSKFSIIPIMGIPIVRIGKFFKNGPTEKTKQYRDTGHQFKTGLIIDTSKAQDHDVGLEWNSSQKTRAEPFCPFSDLGKARVLRP